MFWYKSWLDTRWRFLIGFVILTMSACVVVLGYPRVIGLLRLVPNADTAASGELGRRIRESAELMRSYRGYVFGQWFGQNLVQTWTIFAVLLGSGGLVSSGSESAALFTLSLPVSRNQIVAARAGTGLAELFALAVVPSMIVPLLSPAVGENYRLGDVAAHGICLFIAGTTFFNLALLLSTVFHDVWRPLLITLGIALGLSLIEQVSRTFEPIGIYHVMIGESYFRGGGLPWIGLLVSGAVSAALLYAAAVNLGRRDF